MRGQRAAVLRHLETNIGITSMEAFELYGATRLSAIIFDLKQLGYPIIRIDREGHTRFGDSCRYAEYRLQKERK